MKIFNGIKLRSLHRLSALLLVAFLITHIGNHLAGLAGQSTHIAFMASARELYRHRYVEPLLLLLIVWQAGSGLTLLWRGRKRTRDLLGWMQQLSGLYLSGFLLIHVGAVISGRLILGLDTDFRFAAAGFYVWPYILFFAPYYFLAVLSLFVHAGCGLYWYLPLRFRNGFLASFSLFGFIAALFIVLSLSGALYLVDIPQAYRATYGGA